MQKQQVRAAYDFSAQPGSGELSIAEGETLEVIRENIEGGWMEGRNTKGQVGLFPASYVVKIAASSAPPPSNPPPPLPAYVQPPSNLPPPISTKFTPTIGFDDWGNPLPPAAASAPPTAPPTLPTTGVYPVLSTPSAPPTSHQPLSATQSSAQLHDDDFDDEWSDEDEEVADGTKTTDKLSASMGGEGSEGRRRSRSQSRATNGSRTDLSTDDEATPAPPPNNRPSSAAAVETVTSSKDSPPKSADSTKDKDVPPSTRNNAKEANSGAHGAPSQRQVSRSRSAGPDTISNSGKAGASRMKTINRFSNFVKSGMESYILTQAKLSSQPGETHEVIIKNGVIMWAPLPQSYTAVVDKPKKEFKLKGLKSFIAYSVTSSLNGIQVSRRYKHFDWLHEQLTNKYLLIPIPPLPEKQVSGRYEEDLIEHRKCILQLWVNSICRHPVLSKSEVWQHFITTTDEKKWKNGKRTAEKDEYVGGNFFNCLTVPNQPVDNVFAEKTIDNFVKHCRDLDDSVRVVYDRVAETQKRLIGPYKSNWQKMAAAFQGLGLNFNFDHSSAPVKSAIQESANVLHKIGAQYEDHGKRVTEQLMDFIYTYKGVLANIPDIVGIHKSAFVKLQHNERLQQEGKLSPIEADAIHRRVDVVTYAMLAEINHMSQEANDDFRQNLGIYFAEEADFYIKIGQQLGKLAELYKKT
uniref:Sorting nexin n=1 Tax=Panagrellus redivivus TaxID=6233 RepID=A0A7E4W641_PANRE